MGLHTIDNSLKVFVGGLPADITSQELEAHFKQLGEPTAAEVVKRGVGCIAYSSKEEAEIAISAFNASELKGSVISTEPWGAKFAGSKGKSSGKGWEGSKGYGGYGYKGYGDKGGWGVDKIFFGAKGGFKGYGPDPWTLSMMKGGWGKGWGKGEDEWSRGPSATVSQWTIEVPAGSSIPTAGYPTEAPAIAYDKAAHVFGSASSILSELVGEADDVTFEHDAEWQLYPEVGEAVKAAAGEENCVAVFKCASKGKWGVGVATGWKGREMAGKLALALAIVKEDAEELQKITRNYPDFRRFAQDIGLIPGRRGKIAEPAAAVAATSTTPQVLSIKLPATSKLVKSGLPSETLAVYHEGKHQNSFFNGAIGVLSELVTDVATEVKFEDDPDWTVYPEIGEALKAAGGEETCYTVAIVGKVYGVGAASGWKGREPAAKLAVAIALAQAAGRVEELAQKPEHYQFGVVCAGLGLTQAPAKKPRAA